MHSGGASTDLVLSLTLVAAAVILVLGALFGSVFRRFRQPAVVGEIAAAIVLGPSVLGLVPGNVEEQIFTPDVKSMLSAIAQVGLVLFMFQIGWEFDKALLAKRRATAAAVSIGSVAVSFALGAGLGVVLYAGHSVVAGRLVSPLAFVLFLGAAMAVTAFPVLARILTDNGLMGTRVGALALASAAIDDILAWCILAAVSAIVAARDAASLVQIAVLSAGYLMAMFLIVRPLLARLVRRLTRDRVSPNLLVILVAGVFLSSYATTWIGIHAIFGAFLFGIIMPREPADLIQVGLRRPLESISRLLLPVFFIITGLGVDIGALNAYHLLELAAVLAVACVGKMLGSSLPARMFGGMGWRESGMLGLLMNTRGLTELIILNAGVSLGVLDQSMFTMMVLMTLATTALAGPLLPRPNADFLSGTKRVAPPDGAAGLAGAMARR